MKMFASPTDNAFNDFLANYGFYFALALAILIFIAVVIAFIVSVLKNKKRDIKQNIENKPQEEQLIKYIGGEDNVVSHSINRSRIVLVLKDYSLVDEDKLKSCGVESIIKMSNKITLVSNDASAIYKSLFND